MILPFENDTSRVIRRITSAHLKHDRLKTVITIFAITLTTSLMSSILLLISGILLRNTKSHQEIKTIAEILGDNFKFVVKTYLHTNEEISKMNTKMERRQGSKCFKAILK